MRIVQKFLQQNLVQNELNKSYFAAIIENLYIAKIYKNILTIIKIKFNQNY